MQDQVNKQNNVNDNDHSYHRNNGNLSENITKVEIKCQLDETDDIYCRFFACSTCFGHHYAHHQELESIIQVVAEGYVSGLRDAAAEARKPDT